MRRRPGWMLELVTLLAMLLFVGTAGSVLSRVVSALPGNGAPVQRGLVIAVLLNIALILLGWRRHVALLRTIKAKSVAEEHAHRLATHDPLTGFLNRRSISERGPTLFAEAARQQKAVAVLMLDIDHFKTVNDMYGNAVGDGLLQQVAAEVRQIMPPGAVLARLGGDEFIGAMLFDPVDARLVDSVADRLLSRMAQPFVVDGLALQLSASIGIAGLDQSSADRNGAGIETLMRCADIAMYAAKGAGRDRYVWFDVTMERELRARNELELALRTAIPQQQIVPYFEKQVDLATGRLLGFEVLARWEHPTRGLIAPQQFISIAEETGMIGTLSLGIMRQAFAAARDWDPSLTLSVNLSPHQIKDPWLAQKILKVLTETGFRASRLEIEITESALFENLALVQAVIGSLKDQGIRLALDDFGTGYSSLAHLRALAFDRIKIDRSFVSTLNTNPDSAAMVTAIVRLADSLNLPITAEGIEDAATEQRLMALGCTMGQGYLYGRPIDAGGARRLLAEQRLLVAPPRPPQGESAAEPASRIGLG